MRTTRITITRVSYTPSPEEHNVNKELQYLCGTLGLFNPRDKERSKFRIFIQLLKHAKGGTGLSADELALSLGLSRATVIHHLHNLQASGLVECGGGRYWLRVSNLDELVSMIKADVNETLSSLSDIAKHCDKELGL
ncbi:winged helix-turn-helix transcriptional regulator [Candidatus Woesearchaeota archaeon]|nr:winged helix-turn-helix transcriptional regulator [Candidatus Woesearchaeota archaeon]